MYYDPNPVIDITPNSSEIRSNSSLFAHPLYGAFISFLAIPLWHMLWVSIGFYYLNAKQQIGIPLWLFLLILPYMGATHISCHYHSPNIPTPQFAISGRRGRTKQHNIINET